MALEKLFQPAWNAPEGYSPFSERPPKPSLPSVYQNERAAEAALENLFSNYPDIRLVPQVRITETGYAPQYIDYVAVFPEPLSLRVVGIEVKRGFTGIKDACAAIRQAMRYRKARIADDRLSPFLGDLLPFVFLWPQFSFYDDASDWHPAIPNADQRKAEWRGYYQGAAQALRLFAHHFNVGHVEVEPWWSRDEQEWKPGICLMNGQQTVWTSRYVDNIEDGFRAGVKLADPKRGMRFLK